MAQKIVHFRFYEELNEFLAGNYRKKELPFAFYNAPTVKDAIESFGIPHTEVDLILVNSRSVPFDYHLEANDYISVYPKFESFDISEVTRLRPEPLRTIRFILDVHLGKLSRYLRLMGFDTLYHNEFEDKKIIEIAQRDRRIILTRDIGILKHQQVEHGYFVRSDNPKTQIQEIVHRFDLTMEIRPFSRCMKCNGLIKQTEKPKIQDQLHPGTRRFFHEFYQCSNCGKIYWKGSHFASMIKFLEKTLGIDL